MRDGRSRHQAAVEAVAEVGNPTIIATLTVIAALLPMMFVSGLMGPYMAPIPANASAAMLFSFFVAVVLAPWLMVRFARKALTAADDTGHGHTEGLLGRSTAGLQRRSSRAAGMHLPRRRHCNACRVQPVRHRHGTTGEALPFDNKSEVQVVVDLPEGASRRIPSASCSRLRT